MCAHCSTKPSSSLLLTCTDQEERLGALPGALQLEPCICKHSLRVHACRCTEIIWKLQSFLILIFHLDLSLILSQNNELVSFCPNICVNLLAFLVGLNMLVLHLISRKCHKLFKEEKERKKFPKKSINIQQKYAVASFYSEVRGNWDFTPLTSFKEKMCPTHKNTFWPQSFRKFLKKRVEDNLPLPCMHEFQFRTGKESWYHCVIIIWERNIFNFLKFLLGGM